MADPPSDPSSGDTQWRALRGLFDEGPLVDPLAEGVTRIDAGGGLSVTVSPSPTAAALPGGGEGTEEDTTTGAVCWDGAAAVLRVLAASPEAVRGKRVVELGCGLGAPGVGAALLGAAEVTLTDRAPLRERAERTVELNAAAAACRFQPHDWRAGAAPGSPFDLAIAADCVYDAGLVPALLNCATASAPVVVIAVDTTIRRHGAFASFDAAAAGCGAVRELQPPAGVPGHVRLLLVLSGAAVCAPPPLPTLPQEPCPLAAPPPG
eukprot:TRINITY_DN35422_c0_g1_i1.p1 TRINITY_DN35422_c0_g1~~TRINITY_DN35422_c0_g1_i1.p1  ORF type:complete len:264 (+),score=49.11 TRINITY_DN35422_c0_g1_i1:105-896(+)